jgi:hypothetical protein
MLLLGLVTGGEEANEVDGFLDVGTVQKMDWCNPRSKATRKRGKKAS